MMMSKVRRFVVDPSLIKKCFETVILYEISYIDLRQIVTENRSSQINISFESLRLQDCLRFWLVY
jgi:hypothetical protein